MTKKTNKVYCQIYESILGRGRNMNGRKMRMYHFITVPTLY